MGGNLPWNLVFAGVAIAIVVEILGIPVLPFAVGLYLPIHLSTPMMVGGLIRWFFERKKEYKEGVDRGVLYASGLIAGEGLVGILLAVFAVIPKKGYDSFGDFVAKLLPDWLRFGNWGGLIIFALLASTLVFLVAGSKKSK